MKNMIATLKSIGKSMIKIVAEHVAVTIAILVIVGCLAGLYYACQQGVLDDKSEEVVEIPLGK